MTGRFQCVNFWALIQTTSVISRCTHHTCILCLCASVPLFYNPSLAPNPTPEPCSLVTCPYSGSGVTTTFTMNTTGPFDCGGNCFSCNSSCKHIGVTPAEENMCFSARDVDCFTPVAGESNKVIIKRDCYGCLRCDASNTVKGITRREKFSFNLNRPTGG
eukprot:scpid86144/ scgid0383/ 